MFAEEAIRIINGAVFKPGWRITAEGHTGDSYVWLVFHIETMNTSSTSSDGVFRQNITIYKEVRMYTGNMLCQEELLFMVLRTAAEIDEHENREFLQVKNPDGSWYAPLHPHTMNGNNAWDLYAGSTV